MNGFDWANIVSAVVVSSALNSLWLGLLLTVLAAGLLRLLPRPNAATRHAVWFTALTLVLAAPAMLLIPRPAAAVQAVIPVAASSAPLEVPITAHWPLYAGLAWMAIAAILLARVGWSLVHIHGLKRRATLLARRDNVRVLASSEVRVPMAAGFWQRAIVFPQSVVKELSSEEFEQVLCHEMAHLRRWDDWTQLVHEIARAVLFFNPAIYWIGRRLTIEREMACDDWVVSATGAPRPYAACLTHLHEVTRRASAPQLAPGATTRTRWQISARVEALLQPERNSTTRFSRSGWMAACALASAALIVSAKTTPPVGVQPLPVDTLAMARLNTPAAPAISLVTRKAAPVRPRLLARMAGPGLPPAALPDAPVVLVRAWQVDVSQRYFVITVVFFEPPPPTVLNGI
jgi:beta-lactamase regulating signal transducer with metallopeptidase domain